MSKHKWKHKDLKGVFHKESEVTKLSGHPDVKQTANKYPLNATK
jgi:hypothetical protein